MDSAARPDIYFGLKKFNQDIFLTSA